MSWNIEFCYRLVQVFGVLGACYMICLIALYTRILMKFWKELSIDNSIIVYQLVSFIGSLSFLIVFILFGSLARTSTILCRHINVAMSMSYTTCKVGIYLYLLRRYDLVSIMQTSKLKTKVPQVLRVFTGLLMISTTLLVSSAGGSIFDGICVVGNSAVPTAIVGFFDGIVSGGCLYLFVDALKMKKISEKLREVLRTNTIAGVIAICSSVVLLGAVAVAYIVITDYKIFLLFTLVGPVDLIVNSLTLLYVNWPLIQRFRYHESKEDIGGTSSVRNRTSSDRKKAHDLEIPNIY